MLRTVIWLATKFDPVGVGECQRQVVQTPYGFLVFDDTVIDKNFSRNIELVRKQYSGNVHKVIKGVGVVTCVYIIRKSISSGSLTTASMTRKGTARPSWTMCRTCCSTAFIKNNCRFGQF